MTEERARPVDADVPSMESPQPEPVPPPEAPWQGYSPDVLDAVLET
jgi:hypothetical protein